MSGSDRDQTFEPFAKIPAAKARKPVPPYRPIGRGVTLPVGSAALSEMAAACDEAKAAAARVSKAQAARLRIGVQASLEVERLRAKGWSDRSIAGHLSVPLGDVRDILGIVIVARAT